jgi:hypothetical protein
MHEHELLAGLVAIGALAAVVVWRLVTLRALHLRLIVALLADDLLVPGRGRWRGAGRNRRHAGTFLEDSSRAKRLERHKVTCDGVAVLAAPLLLVERVIEAGAYLLDHLRMAPHAATVRDGDRVVREAVVLREVVPDFFERRGLVGKVRDDASIDVTVHALCLRGVATRLPGGVVRLHLVTRGTER